MASEASSAIPVAPQHPVPSMRAAFEESVLESDGAHTTGLEEPSSSRSRHNRPFRPQHHRLRKLVAQIAFGLYLLHDGLAKSDSAVVRILQGHINDMDDFLSSTTAEFEGASADIATRLLYLRLPLDESGGIADVFDRMLESREFRMEMMARNEKVDFVVQRTTSGLQASLHDIREGLAAVDELAKYLLELKDGWRKVNLVRVYTAMTHNAALWFRCCVGLQMKGARLGEKLNQLQSVVQEIERRTGAASRRNKSIIAAAQNTQQVRVRFQHLADTVLTQLQPHRLLDKPLPETPRSVPAVPRVKIQIPNRTSSHSTPHGRHTRRARSSPQLTPSPPPPIIITAPEPNTPTEPQNRRIKTKLRDSFRRAKSTSELKKVDKGKQRAVPVREEDEPEPQPRFDVVAPPPQANVKSKRSRLLRVVPEGIAWPSSSTSSGGLGASKRGHLVGGNVVWTQTGIGTPEPQADAFTPASRATPRVQSAPVPVASRKSLLRRISTIVLRRGKGGSLRPTGIAV